MGGTLAGTDSWFNNSASQVSAHFGAGFDGELHQYVDLGNTAWANGILEPGQRWDVLLGALGRQDLIGWNPNGVTVSIETEDMGDPAFLVAGDEYRATLAACQLALGRYPGIRVVTGHHVISPASRKSCPGSRWTASGQLARLASELGLTLFI